MQPFRVALDWTPNTNHAPIILSMANSHYASAGLDVQLISPSSDSYSTTPATKVARGEVDIALCPSESVISHRLARTPARLTAVAALLARDASAVTVLESSGIARPSELEGKRYASYGARFEDATIRAVVCADGGQGAELKVVSPPKLAIWDSLMAGDADATWVFPAWEGVMAKQKGALLRYFTLEEFGVPYGYSPVFVVNEDLGNSEAARKFLMATSRGAEDLFRDLDNAVTVVEKVVPAVERDLVRESLLSLVEGEYFAGSGEWGKMKAKKWEEWAGWLRGEGLVPDDLKVDTLYTNELLSEISEECRRSG